MPVSFKDVVAQKGDPTQVIGALPVAKKEDESRSLFKTVFSRETLGDIKEGFLGVGEDLSRRGEIVNQAGEARLAGKQGFARTAFQQLGQVAGGASDILGRAVITGAKVFTTQEFENKVSTKMVDVMKSLDVPFTDKDIPTLMSDYSIWAEQNPESARDVAAAGAIAEFVLDRFGLKTVGRAAQEAGRLAGDATSIAKRTALQTAQGIKNSELPSFSSLAGKPMDIYNRLGSSYAMRNAVQVPNAEAQLAQTYTELFDVKKGFRAQAFEDAVKIKRAEQRGLVVRAPEQILSEAHIIPNADFGEMQFRTLQQAAELRAQATVMSDAVESFVARSDAFGRTRPVSVETLKKDALRAVNEMTGVTETERAAIRRALEREIGLLGEEVDHVKLLELKRSAQANTNYDKTIPEGSIQNNTNKILGSVYRSRIEEDLLNAGMTDLAQVNREVGDIMRAADYLDALDGQQLPTPEYAKSLRFTGAALGLAQGPGGAVAGWYAGMNLANLIRLRAVSPVTSRWLLNNLEGTYPDTYKELLRQMDELDMQDAQKLLPAPGQAPIQLPSSQR